jgi:hypothetical protein
MYLPHQRAFELAVSHEQQAGIVVVNTLLSATASGFMDVMRVNALSYALHRKLLDNRADYFKVFPRSQIRLRGDEGSQSQIREDRIEWKYHHDSISCRHSIWCWTR